MADFTNIFPNAKQFDTMNTLLAVIASKTGEAKIDSWYDVQQAVRLGVAPTLFPIGTQLISERAKTLTATVTGSTGVTAATVVAAAFIAKVGSVHGGAYEFVYDGGAWRLNDEAVILADYGITVTGTAAEGDKIVVQETTEKIVWDVVAHDYNVDPHNQYEHSMTLLTHECTVSSLQYDSREALFYIEDRMPAGTYNFTVKESEWSSEDIGKTFRFTLTKEIPAGGQIVLMADYNVTIAGSTVKTFASSSSETELETATVTEGASGISLGDVGNAPAGNINSLKRAQQGSNNWKESAMRRFLNSDDAAGSVWKPQTKFDRPPAWASSQAGWMNGLDPQFLAVVGTARINCKTNNEYEVDGSIADNYNADDKFWLASLSEIYGKPEGGLSDGTQFPYYEGSTDADKIKYNTSGAACRWWLRSPTPWQSHTVRYVYTDGVMYGEAAVIADGVAVTCVIF